MAIIHDPEHIGCRAVAVEAEAMMAAAAVIAMDEILAMVDDTMWSDDCEMFGIIVGDYYTAMCVGYL